MTKDFVLDLIRKGEGQTIEFKEILPTPKAFSRELCAFANSNDGYIIIGVTDEGEVRGYAWKRGDDEYIINVGSNNCAPHIIPVVHKVSVGDAHVAVLEVLRGEHRPYKANNVVYVRENAVTRPAEREQEVRLLQNGGYVNFDTLPCVSALMEDFDKEMVDAYIEKRVPALRTARFNKKKDVLLNLRYACEKNKKVVPTNAGILAFGDFPQKFIAQARVKCFYIKGIKRTDYIADHKLIEGNITGQIYAAVDFLTFATKVSRITKGGRKDVPQYARDALQEAVANAVAHRDYFITGREILVFVYENRIEIESPGGLGGNLRVSELGRKRYARNPVLSQFLYEMGVVEGAGRGIERIREAQCALGAKKPRFTADRDTFTAILYPSFVV